MKARVQQHLGEAKSKMNGYVMLLNLRYSNLCVKADPVSLLSVTVRVDDDEMNIENVAEVGLVNEDTLGVIPKSANLLYDIGRGVMEAHPEFKMDVVQNENSDDEEDKYLTFTMPKVDKPRHDLLMDGVKGLNDQCQAKIDAVFDYYTAQIGIDMANAEASQIDQVKDMLKEVYDFHNDMLKKMTDTKKQDIEDAYQRYVQAMQEKEQQAMETAAAHNPMASMSMKMPGE